MEEKIKSVLQKITEMEYYDEQLEMSLFKNSPFEQNAVTCCTASAKIIANELGGDVYGYLIEEDENIIGYGSGGHDFVIAGNYLIDWWAENVECTGKAILNMNDEQDRKIIETRYLPRKFWKKIKP